MELPVARFWANAKGYPTNWCKACKGESDAGRYRNKYAADPDFREVERRRAAANFQSRYWRNRPLDSGRVVRICNCHGKVCRLWLQDDTIRCAVSARALTRFGLGRSA